MKATILVLSAAAAVVALARPQGGYGVPGGPIGPIGPAKYNFQWEVNDPPSGNSYGHQEQRDGDSTKGSYYVLLPDTRRMLVEYFVDQFGYHPTVTFEGKAVYPTGPGPQKGYYP
nr:pro-resilin-like [Procambarus clarkii]